jgi:putative ATP-binding cassette transporter
MDGPSRAPAAPASAAPRPPNHHGVFRALGGLAAPYWRGERRWHAWGHTVALVLLGVALVLLAMWINLWTAELFDALERRSAEHFIQQVAVFALIVALSMAANGANLVVKRRIQLAWREALTRRVVGGWMARARHYQIALVPGDHDNPDGRIAEDIRITTETAVELGQSLLYCALLLIAFTGILWALSGTVEAFGLPVPGHMVGLAMLYAAAGSAIAFLLGRRLVRATDRRQGTEADFRFGLVRAREGAEGIALARAEGEERGRLAALFGTIAAVWNRQTMFLGRLMVFSAGYATLAPVFPILATTPRYLAGAVTLGGLMQVAQAFQQVTVALSWPVDNFARIAEWRASVDRVLALCLAMEELDAELAEIGSGTARIERVEAPRLAVRGLDVANADGTAVATGITLEVASGELVLVAGDPLTAAAVLRVLAGIWPWGRGRIERPEGDDGLAFLGPAPWLPAGTLARGAPPSRRPRRHARHGAARGAGAHRAAAPRRAAGRGGGVGARASAGRSPAPGSGAAAAAPPRLGAAARRDRRARPAGGGSGDARAG